MAIPQYAQHIPRSQLVKVFCRMGCRGKTRYAKVSKPHWDNQGPNLDSDVYATCLVCHCNTRDSYNWTRI